MRTIKQLLELMLERQELFHSGLCLWADNLWLDNLITYYKLTLLKDYIESNKPENAGDTYYWKMGEIAPRIEWINQQIEMLCVVNFFLLFIVY